MSFWKSDFVQNSFFANWPKKNNPFSWFFGIEFKLVLSCFIAIYIFYCFTTPRTMTCCLKCVRSYKVWTVNTIVYFFFFIAVPAKIVSFGGLIERPWRTFIKLPCTAVGYPVPKRQWLKSFRAIQSWDGNVQVTENGDVTIASLQRSNSDNYTCHVENTHGADSVIYQIIVQGKIAVDNILLIANIFYTLEL